MQPKLAELFSEIESQRVTLLKMLSHLHPEALNKSRNKKWSISQILGHIILAEQLSLSYMTKKINAINDVGMTGFFGEIKLYVFILSQRLPLKYKAPKNLSNKPRAFLDFNSMELEWVKSREELKNFLESFPGDGLKKKIYRHPVMGRSNIIHALTFFREHLIHHYPQIKRQL